MRRLAFPQSDHALSVRLDLLQAQKSEASVLLQQAPLLGRSILNKHLAFTPKTVFRYLDANEVETKNAALQDQVNDLQTSVNQLAKEAHVQVAICTCEQDWNQGDTLEFHCALGFPRA